MSEYDKHIFKHSIIQFLFFFQLIVKEPSEYQNNIRLYEKTLSLCPLYPSGLSNVNYVEVACGHGGGIEWIHRTYGNIMSTIKGKL